MGLGLTGWREQGRGAGLALALVALVTLLLVPPGYMAGGGQAPGLVICTGQGPLVLTASGLRKAPKAPRSPKAAPDAPCAFAGHGAASAPDLAPAPAAPTAVVHIDIAETPADLVPGRGLAAPPPPSQAPPSTDRI